MAKRLPPAAFAAAAAAALLGCDASQEVWIHEDGSVRVRAELAVPEQLRIITRGEDEDPFGRLEAELAEARRKLEVHPAVASVEFGEHSEAGVHRYLLEVAVKHYRHLPELQEECLAAPGALFALFDKLKSPERPGERPRLTIDAGAADRGLSLRLTLPPLAPSLRLEAEGKPGPKLVAAALARNYYTVTLHAPRILSANGLRAEDAKSVVWKTSLGELLSSGEPRDLWAVVELPSGGRFWWVLGGLAAAAAAGGIVSQVRETRKRAARARPAAP